MTSFIIAMLAGSDTSLILNLVLVNRQNTRDTCGDGTSIKVRLSHRLNRTTDTFKELVLGRLSDFCYYTGYPHNLR